MRGMPAAAPTILATSGGLRRGSRTMFEFGPLLLHAVELSGVAGRAPRVCHVGTAGGDPQWFNALFAEGGQAAGITCTPPHLFPVPSIADPVALLPEQAVVAAGDASGATLMAAAR